MCEYMDSEFISIIKPILEMKEFQKLKDVSHHGSNRFDHSLRVAYFSYKITKFFHLNYQEATIAALLHDFFIDEVDNNQMLLRLRRHPNHALENAKRIWNLSPLQEDVIKTHMFPITFIPPKYLESWVVDIVDDGASIYERGYNIRREIKTVTTFLLLFIINYIKFQ